MKKRGIARGAVLSVVLALLGMAGVLYALVANASPYGTFAEAKANSHTNMHVAGDILKQSVVHDIRAGVTRFEMKDETGAVQAVVYKGAPPANMGEASKVVAIGGFKDGHFNATGLLVKCPSRYEAETKS